MWKSSTMDDKEEKNINELHGIAFDSIIENKGDYWIIYSNGLLFN